LDKVVLAPQDTSLVPDSGPTVASRTAMSWTAGAGSRHGGQGTAEAGAGAAAVEKSYIQPDSIHWDENTYRGDAYPVYAWGAPLRTSTST